MIVDSHIGYGSPHKVDTAEAHGEPLGEEEVRETKKAYDWPEDAQFLVPDGRARALRRGDRQARRASCGRSGRSCSTAIAASTRPARASSTGCSAASCPRAGTTRSPPSIPTRRGWRPGRPRTRSRTRSPSRSPGCSPAPPTSPARPRSGSRAPTRFEPRRRGGRQLHLGIREHESAALCNGLSLSKLRPLWSTYLTFSDYAQAGDPALAR